MFSLFSKRIKELSVPEQIYGVVVAQARDERFFTDFGIEDTVMGRFDVLALHVFLFSRRMKQENIVPTLSNFKITSHHSRLQ